MFVNFIFGIVIGTIVNYIIFINFTKLRILSKRKILLLIIAIVLLLIYTSLQTLYGFEHIIPTIVEGVVMPIDIMIFIYLIVSRRSVN